MAKKKTIKNKVTKKTNKRKLEPIDSLETDIEESDEKKKSDRYDEHGCQFLNEAECEEELEDDGLELDEVEKSHYEEDDNE